MARALGWQPRGSGFESHLLHLKGQIDIFIDLSFFIFHKNSIFLENSKMIIKKQELIKIIERLSREIELNCNKEMSFHENYYWETKPNDSFNLNVTPELVMGELNNDWDDLRRLLDKENVSLSYDLKRLSSILLLLEFKLGSDWISQDNEEI